MAHRATVLLTRPQVTSQSYAEELHTLKPDLNVIISPLLAITFNDIPAGALADRLPIFTSKNGVEAFSRSAHPARGLAFCVGEATARAAKDLGFSAKASGGTVEHLIADLLKSAPDMRFIHISGTHTRGALTDRLKNAGYDATSFTAYDQSLLPLTEEARKALCGKEPVTVPLFSPRTAEHFASQCPEQARPTLIALSEAVAAPLTGATICSQPTAEAMTSTLMRVIDNLTAP